uniref:Uncharacterized protein n=1 Tax=Steinernema glaseri TaxID=37863 RepID=A0A1I8AI63_9BILA
MGRAEMCTLEDRRKRSNQLPLQKLLVQPTVAAVNRIAQLALEADSVVVGSQQLASPFDAEAEERLGTNLASLETMKRTPRTNLFPSVELWKKKDMRTRKKKPEKCQGGRKRRLRRYADTSVLLFCAPMQLN